MKWISLSIDNKITHKLEVCVSCHQRQEFMDSDKGDVWKKRISLKVPEHPTVCVCTLLFCLSLHMFKSQAVFTSSLRARFLGRWDSHSVSWHSINLCTWHTHEQEEGNTNTGIITDRNYEEWSFTVIYSFLNNSALLRRQRQIRIVSCVCDLIFESWKHSFSTCILVFRTCQFCHEWLHKRREGRVENTSSRGDRTETGLRTKPFFSAAVLY
jgi:hypothetical protein